MKIVGIAACPAGLAHTPMAAKALEKAGAKLGYDLKMEQQGSMGQVNKITEEEAKEADRLSVNLALSYQDYKRRTQTTWTDLSTGEKWGPDSIHCRRCIKFRFKNFQ